MFQPVIPLDGLAGWRFLQSTYDAQFEAFSKSNIIQRDAEYFAENIGNVASAEDLVADRRLLTVALGAFGLQDDITNRYFIQKILEEGTAADDALANRLSDTRYRDLAQAFRLGPAESSPIGTPGFAENIIGRFEANGFEVAAGEQNDAMRVALYAERALPELANSDVTNDAKWFTILGDPPMRALFEKALNLPASIGQIDIDQQLSVFKDQARKLFGSDDVAQFSDADLVQETITRFVVRNQIDELNAGFSSGSVALTLLQSIR